MAFSLTQMTPVGATKDAAVWVHYSSDNAATAEAANYFDDNAANMAAAGLIISVDSDGTSVNLYGFTNTGTVVTVLTGAVAVTGPGVEFT